MGRENGLYETRRAIVDGGAEAIFTGGRGWAGLTREREAEDRPFLVLLYGPPGSGKSSALTREVVTEGLGLQTENAASISLDSLVESLVPFRRATAEIWGKEDFGKTKEGKNKTKEGVAAGVYLNFIQRTGNNSLNMEAKKGPLPKLIDVRNSGLEEAIVREIDILFEMVISDTKKDKVGEEIFERLERLGKLDRYDIYVVYPWVESGVLQERLRKRPLKQMKEEVPFFRGVSPKLADMFINSHREYMKKFIFPRAKPENIIGYRLLGVAPTHNTDNTELLGRIQKVIIFNNTLAVGGGRKGRRRMTKRKVCAKRRKTLRG
jgi:hypothetical protein